LWTVETEQQRTSTLVIVDSWNWTTENIHTGHCGQLKLNNREHPHWLLWTVETEQ